MHNIANICCQQDHRQRTNDGCAVFCNNRTQQTEYTNRRQLQNHLHTLHKDSIQAIDACDNWLCFLTHQNNCKANQNSHYNDLQHACGIQRVNKVGWENIDQRVHKRGSLCRLIAQICRCNHREHSLKQIAANQTNGNGKRSGTQIVQHGFQTNRTDFSNIRHRNNTAHNRKQYNWHDDKLQQIEKNRAERVNVRLRKIRMISQQQTCNNCKNQCNENLHRERQFLFFFHFDKPFF